MNETKQEALESVTELRETMRKMRRLDRLITVLFAVMTVATFTGAARYYAAGKFGYACWWSFLAGFGLHITIDQIVGVRELTGMVRDGDELLARIRDTPDDTESGSQ